LSLDLMGLDVVVCQLTVMSHLHQNKNTHTVFLWWLWQIWTNSNNPFTVAFCDELRKNLLYNPPPHLKYIATLPSKFERSSVQLHTTVIQFKVW